MKLLVGSFVAALLVATLAARETRGLIFGRILDPSGATTPGGSIPRPTVPNFGLRVIHSLS